MLVIVTGELHKKHLTFNGSFDEFDVSTGNKKLILSSMMYIYCCNIDDNRF